ncbi:MAG: SGNH/GDSL hydrolase family protein [Clostridia bacterium]|nr:SGNH/GDSL hydrolase family protein [Clostridia bacterium]
MDLRGKDIYFLGSSVTFGVEGVSMAELLCAHFGAVMHKEAVSGTTLADIDARSYISRFRAAPETPADLFICQLSTNDAARDLPLGDIETALRDIIAEARRRWNCPMLFYTGTRYENAKYAEMVALLHRLQGEYGFAVLDLWNDEEMNAVSRYDYARFMRDPVHPTLTGYRKWWLPKFIAACEAL